MPKKPTQGKTPKAALANAKGCCVIGYDDKPDEQIPGISRTKCKQIAKERNGTAQWTPGACAEP